MIRMAIVGAHGYGWELIEQIQRASETVGCKLVAAADDRLSEFPEKVDLLKDRDVEIHTDAAEMFRQLRGRCEIIYIATGIHSHLPLTEAAMAAGFHVHLEKPPTATVQEADALAQLPGKYNKSCLVGFQALHSEDVRALAQRVAAGKLGRLRTIACWACEPRTISYYTRNEWAGRLRAGGKWVLDGPATNALAHQIMNMLLWASGDETIAQPLAVRAEMYAAHPRVDGHDTAAIEIETAGPKVYFFGSHAVADKCRATIYVEGDAGRAEWSIGTGFSAEYADGTTESVGHDRLQRQRMVENIATAVRENRPEIIRCAPADARAMVAVVNGAYESSGRVNRIDREHCTQIDAGEPTERLVVEGLEAILEAGARQCKLPSELAGAPAWTRGGQRLDLVGYGQFPQRFEG
jgi:predicted dehydrogenase